MNFDYNILSEAIKLALLLQSHFKKGTLAIHPNQEFLFALRQSVSCGLTTVKGVLNLSYGNVSTNACAACSFTIRPDWKNHSPYLRCTNNWIRSEPDIDLNANWHMNSDHSICYVLDDEWRDAIAAEEQAHGEESAMEFAAFYAVNNARWLLYHHMEGYRRKLFKWPQSWAQWPHYEAGKMAYKREKAQALKSEQTAQSLRL